MYNGEKAITREARPAQTIIAGGANQLGDRKPFTVCELDDLTRTINNLEESTGMLLARLGPVLNLSPRPSKDDKCPEQTLPELPQAIRVQRHRLEQLTVIVMAALQGLEI